MPDKSNIDVAIRIQEKFEFYFLSLTFVILGLSIQTSKFGVHAISDGLELLGWISLFVSGMAGLSRMRWAPFLYKVKDAIIRREWDRDDAKRRELNGQTRVTRGEEEIKIDDFIADVSQAVKEVEDQLSKLETKNNLKSWLHVYGFTFGVLFLMGSRGYEPAVRFVGCLFK
jgi:hypothetical protein